MIYVKITDRTKLSVQHMAVLYAEIVLLKPNSYIAESIKVLLPQGLFTVNSGSEVVIRYPDSPEPEVLMVIGTNEPELMGENADA